MKQPHAFISLHTESLNFQLIPTGDIFEMTSGPFLINQFRGNARDGSANNIYLRIYDKDQIASVHPLLGQASQSKISCQKDIVRFQGTCENITYSVDLFLVENSWFYEITLDSGTEVTVDLLYGQDIAISGKDNVLTNELYISQYLGHSIFNGPNGHVICSRQNMPDSGCNPYLQQGCLFHKATHYSTDGLDFFGLEYKQSGQPAALFGGLTDQNLQYEFAYTSLLTEVFTFSGKDVSVFYGHFRNNHPDKVTSADFIPLILEQYDRRSSDNKDFSTVQSFQLRPEFHEPWNSAPMSSEEIDQFFPVQTLAETDEGKLLSFFTPDHAHVVTQEKERKVVRPHGSIIITPPELHSVPEALISSTHYMYGVFNSHVVLGNTNMHKFLSTPRGFLNIQKNSGQRIYIRLNSTYHLLSLPALYEMGMNYSRWYYKIEDDLLLVTSYCTGKQNTDPDHSAESTANIQLEVSSTKGRTYDFIVTHQLAMSVNEYSRDIDCETIAHGLHFPFETAQYPALAYRILTQEDCKISDDRIFFTEEQPFDETFLTFSYTDTASIHMTIAGSYGAFSSPCAFDFESEKTFALNHYASVMNHFAVTATHENERFAILNETAWWYTHNAMIHYSMPHGLEQPGGAAWGTRDICQGPIEYYLATGNMPMIRDILLTVFSHQEDQSKEWPQWFMFDRYEMNAGECHGDVVFWPLKSVADYLSASGDFDILNEQIPFADNPDKKSTLIAHIQDAVAQIQNTRFIENTGLITYAGGDWDDTLQPAQPEMKERLISSWTQALAYQTFALLGTALRDFDPLFAAILCDLADETKKAFLNYTIKDQTIAGFLEWDTQPRCLLHPADTQTGIHYRLLPQTRSIIAELVSPQQAAHNIDIIHEHLAFPDGIHLMDTPATYDGGVSHLFKRAEQAANVGREISLQYTHAHIRYIEAMAKYGNRNQAWDGLFQINPILIQKSVPNAELRQSNMYFSSSDGDFKDRYDYQKNIMKLRTGDIKAKGGWRLYSSGPGIYLHQVISHILGIRFQADAIIIDPVLPEDLGDFKLTFSCFGELCTFHYTQKGSTGIQMLHNGTAIACDRLSNPYRDGGIIIKKSIFLACDSRTYTIHY